MQSLYHITTKTEADSARAAGEYVPVTFAEEGFIHCSYAGQIHGVANRYYQGQNNLVVLKIDPARLTCAIIDENLIGGSELFPHIYGRLSMAAVIDQIDYPCKPDGSFDPPARL